MTQPVINSSDVLIAGVAWPRYKVFALVAGLLTLLLIGTVTTSAAAAVLGAAGVAVVVGLVLKTFQRY